MKTKQDCTQCNDGTCAWCMEEKRQLEGGLPPSVLTKKQTLDFGPKYFMGGGRRYKITAHVRYDDCCNNGHNSFAITASIYREMGVRTDRWDEDSFGCCHDDISKRFPNLRPFIKWHGVSSDGPMHYPGNVTYHAGERDCHGLLKGESRQLRNGGTGKLSWILEADRELPKYVDADECPSGVVTVRYVPWCRIGEGKPRELDHARSSAVWPDATDEQLCLPKEQLEALLIERLPVLMAEFRKDVESLGFIY